MNFRPPKKTLRVGFVARIAGSTAAFIWLSQASVMLACGSLYTSKARSSSDLEAKRWAICVQMATRRESWT